MKIEYDNYYQKGNLFGNPYPELIEHYSKIEHKGRLLDIGCGQGRDSIPLAKMGFDVTAIDHSEVGIQQMNDIARKQNLSLQGIVTDLYTYSKFSDFEFILLDSMFHLAKRDKEREVSFLNKIFDEVKANAQITICLQNTGKKGEILHSILENRTDLQMLNQTDLIYTYVDDEAGHSSDTSYLMISVKKLIIEITN